MVRKYLQDVTTTDVTSERNPLAALWSALWSVVCGCSVPGRRVTRARYVYNKAAMSGTAPLAGTSEDTCPGFLAACLALALLTLAGSEHNLLLERREIPVTTSLHPPAKRLSFEDSCLDISAAVLSCCLGLGNRCYTHSVRVRCGRRCTRAPRHGATRRTLRTRRHTLLAGKLTGTPTTGACGGTALAESGKALSACGACAAARAERTSASSTSPGADSARVPATALVAIGVAVGTGLPVAIAGRRGKPERRRGVAQHGQ